MQLLIFSQTLDDWTCQNLQFLKSYMMGSSLLLSAPSAFPHHCVNVLGSKISQSEFHQIRLSWLQSLFDRKVYRGGLLHIDLFYYPSEPLSALLKVSLLVGQAGLRGSLKGNLRTAFRVLTEGQTSCTSECSIQIRHSHFEHQFRSLIKCNLLPWVTFYTCRYDFVYILGSKIFENVCAHTGRKVCKRHCFLAW